MYGIFYIHHLVINPDNWFINFLITTAGVGLALAGQEFINWLHRKHSTIKFIEHLIEETNRNLEIVGILIETCDEMIARLENSSTAFGFPSVFGIAGTASTFRRDAYEAVKQSENYLSFTPEISLKMARGYSRLADIRSFIDTMVITWEASEKEAAREEVSSTIVEHQRREQTMFIIKGARAIAIEVQDDLKKLVVELRISRHSCYF